MAAPVSSVYWVIATPNSKGVPAGEDTQAGRDERAAQTRSKLVTALGGPTSATCRAFPFNIPPLKVGTLDSLMALSDELHKHDSSTFQLVQRIERAYVEIFARDVEDEKEEGKGEAKSVGAGGERGRAPPLMVDTTTRAGASSASPDEFVRNFVWNATRYPSKRATLRFMVEQIIKEATKADVELKKQMGEYNEVRNSVLTIERKETGTLMVKPLGPYVKREHIVEGEYVTTALVVLPKIKEAEFKGEYERMDQSWYAREVIEQKRREDDAKAELERQRKRAADAGLPPPGSAAEAKRTAAAAAATAASAASAAASDHEVTPEEMKRKLEQELVIAQEIKAAAELKRQEAELIARRREKERKVPNIFPRSFLKLGEDEEFVLVRIILLKKGLDTFKAICRDRRYAVRDFKYDPEQDKTNKKQLQKLEAHKKELYNFLVMWCKSTYSEVFSAWVHLKAMRCFVEAVLRYGLPVNFSATILQPQGRGSHDKKIRTVLKDLYGNLAAANLTSALDASETDLSGFGQDFYPYVYLNLNLGSSD